MTDKERVIKGLESLHERLLDAAKQNAIATLDASMVADALAMLKEQGEQAISVDTKVIGTEHGDIEVYCCRACRYQLDPAFHFCPNCGKKVKWE